MADFQTSNLRMELRPDGIAFLRLDVPDHSINVLNRQVLADLSAALDHLAVNPSIRLLVIRSDKVAGFIAGADLQAFARIATSEEAQAISAAGQSVFNKLAALPVPSIGLIHGPCLGGGLELALACDYRILLDHPKTQLGLPEVELGLVPGWGGTQRLPRIVGLERALHVILAGRRLKTRDALRWGLADAVGQTEAELADRLRLLTFRAIGEGKRPVMGLPLRTWRQRLLESTRWGRFMVFRGTERLLRRVPDDMPAPLEALQTIRFGLRHGFEAGLAQEREAAGRLAMSPACRNLINLFLTRESARRLPENLPVPRPEIKRIGIVGVGAMGAGIAQLAAIRGFEIIVHEVNEAALAAGMAKISNLFQKAVQNQVLTRQTAEQKLASLRQDTDWSGFATVDLVIEAVNEDLQVKQAVFRELEKRTQPTAILATNTSSLLVRQLQEGMQHPERVAGLHFFNPVHKLPLVEVIRGPATADSTTAALLQWASALGKTPVLVMDSPGFVVNRILMPYLAEAVLLFAEGMAVPTIDEIMRRFGMPMGPLEMLDQIGLDVAAYVARGMKPILDGRPGGSATTTFLINAFEHMRQNGWLGQKSRLGFYRYRGKSKKPHSGLASQLPATTVQKKDDVMRSMPLALQRREARERLVLPMVNEAADCLAERVAADAATIDLAMVLGTGWAPHRGGPLQYAEQRGHDDVVKSLEELARRHGPRFEPSEALRTLRPLTPSPQAAG